VVSVLNEAGFIEPGGGMGRGTSPNWGCSAPGVVPGCGRLATETSTLTAPLTNGNPYTTLTVTPTQTALGNGAAVTLTLGANSQTVYTSSEVAAGVTSIPVTSFYANYGYTTSTTVSLPLVTAWAQHSISTGLNVQINRFHDWGLAALNDAAGIYITGYSGSTIIYNTYLNSDGGLQGAHAGSAIYLDTGTTGVDAENNVVANVVGYQYNKWAQLLKRAAGPRPEHLLR
jgi:hypothetical protein